jgi:DNA/RNA endonuclease G (NUC1)
MPHSSVTAAGEKLLAQEHYLVWYDSDLRTPLWTASLLTKSDIAKKLTRKDSFRSDPRLTDAEKSECADYKEPIFDQGHMVPNGDMTRGNTAMDNSFLMSNMTPQHCAFNRGVWQVLESRVRDWASQVDKTWVITGVILDRKKPIGRDPDADAWKMNGKKGRRVAIPSAQYKIIVREVPGGYETLSIMLPNNDTKHAKTKIPKVIAGSVTTLDAIAQRSGFRFLHSAQVEEESAPWPHPKKWAGPLTAKCNANYPDR